MSIVKEFREFAVKGNVVDMGVGIVIGAAFTSIVNSFVNDIVNPLLGALTGGIDFSHLFLDLSGKSFATLQEAKAAGAATLNYGVFLNSIFSFLIVAWALFMVIRGINSLKRAEALSKQNSPAAPAPLTKSEQLLTEIKDLLRK